MRVECQSCRELVVATFAVVDGAIVSTCSACHATMRASETTGALTTTSPATRPQPTTPRCPKCGAPRAAAAACPGCGLATDRMDAFAESRDAAVPEAVRTAWQRVVEGWEEPARHEELFRRAAHHSSYAWVAGRYREAQRDHPADRIAETQLERVRRAAEAALMVTATRPPDPSKKTTRGMIALLVVVVLLTAIGIVYYQTIHDERSVKPPVGQPLRP